MASVYKKSGRWWLRFKGADGRWARRARKSHHEGPPRDSKRSNASGSRGSSVKAWLRTTTTAGARSNVTSRRRHQCRHPAQQLDGLQRQDFAAAWKRTLEAVCEAFTPRGQELKQADHDPRQDCYQFVTGSHFPKKTRPLTVPRTPGRSGASKSRGDWI